MLSDELGYWFRFKEQFVKGAFVEYLEDDNDVKVLNNHDTSKVFARRKYSTLEINEDDVGLRFLVELPNNTQGNDIYESIKRGDVDGVSVGFKMLIQEWNEESDPAIRTIKKAELPEFSFTAFPAYESTETNVRNNVNEEKAYLLYLNERRRQTLKTIQRSEEINKLKSNGGII